MTIDTRDPTGEKPNKLRWGELDDDDGEGLEFLLPSRQVSGPDENGIKKTIEYRFDDDGRKVKIRTTTRLRKLTEAQVSKRVMERRIWFKFGDAVGDNARSMVTVVSKEAIFLERPGNRKEETQVTGNRPSRTNDGVGVIMVCRTCGKKGDHWTARCPYKDLVAQEDVSVNPPAASESHLPTSASKKSSYVPPSMRVNADRSTGPDMRRRNDENSVRVTNLSEDTREDDLHDLFRSFGAVTRVYVVMDKETGISRGFGFVNFVNIQDAQRAISKLNGYGYDNLILRVEWATPRTN